MSRAFIILAFARLALAQIALSDASCELSNDWAGRWFHLGFNDPLVITRNQISGKGHCVLRSKNMFLMEESEPGLGKCHRCMVIYEKHFNVLQYKESYCEENIESMESLCNTIPGDAPLYSMFRKDGKLVKCPFRGPFSFSYSKGSSGQVCNYPASFMDTCSDNKRLQLRYQACLDVEGSEIAKEQMACLATWKEGSSRYLVSMMNHSHVYTDEARYRCFVYQKQPGERQVTYKMAQSGFASCLDLWNVNEGYRTFTMKKLESDKTKCEFPTFVSKHHDWHSVDGRVSLHINKRGRSLRLRNHTALPSMYDDSLPYLETHVTCHSSEMDRSTQITKLVTYVKAGCDSGFVCLMFYSHDRHVIQMRYGDKSRDPSEACMNYYFDPNHSPLVTLVSGGHNTRPCPFSGRYSLTGGSLTALLGGQLNCDNAVMHAGCSASDDIIVESTCSRNLEDNVRIQWSCHGRWQHGEKQLLVLSTPNLAIKGVQDFVCLSHTEKEGILSASAHMDMCNSVHSDGVNYNRITEDLFNITSSGPCLQALTGHGERVSYGPLLWPMLVAVYATMLLL